MRSLVQLKMNWVWVRSCALSFTQGGKVLDPSWPHASLAGEGKTPAVGQKWWPEMKPGAFLEPRKVLGASRAPSSELGEPGAGSQQGPEGPKDSRGQRTDRDAECGSWRSRSLECSGVSSSAAGTQSTGEVPVGRREWKMRLRPALAQPELTGLGKRRHPAEPPREETGVPHRRTRAPHV